MTFDDRVQVVAKRGFTDRQARFLVTVMLHAGVCVPPSTRGFAASSTARRRGYFFAKLMRLGYASMYDCRHNRARIYHLNQRALYAVIRLFSWRSSLFDLKGLPDPLEFVLERGDQFWRNVKRCVACEYLQFRAHPGHPVGANRTRAAV